jgi:hypothetical protein
MTPLEQALEDFQPPITPPLTYIDECTEMTEDRWRALTAAFGAAHSPKDWRALAAGYRHFHPIMEAQP